MIFNESQEKESKMLECYVLQNVPSSDVSKVVNEEKKLKIFLQEIQKQTRMFAMDVLGGQEVAQDLAGMKKQLKELPAQIDRLDQEQTELFWDIIDYIEIKMKDFIAQDEPWPEQPGERFRDRKPEVADPDIKA